MMDAGVHTGAVPGRLGVVLGGGGALAAYQVGVLSHLAERCPHVAVPILSGVSAGAINAAALAAIEAPALADRVARLRAAWEALTPAQVFRVNGLHLIARGLAWLLRLGTGGLRPGPRPRSLLDTAPLRRFLTARFATADGSLPGIARNIAAGTLDSVALTGSSFVTGRSVTWVAGCTFGGWERADRSGHCVDLRIEHVMASAALPLLFPAEAVGGEFFGDGGLMLTAPLSPAIHMGADRILAISTRHPREAASANGDGYPPPAQIAGALLNALFLDQLDADALRLQRINELLAALPPERHQGLRPLRLLVMRPSVDLGHRALAHELELPWALRFLTRGLGTRETRHQQLLSLLMFQPGYVRELIDLGRADAAARSDELCRFALG